MTSALPTEPTEQRPTTSARLPTEPTEQRPTTSAHRSTEPTEPGVPGGSPRWHGPAKVGAAVAAGTVAITVWNPGDSGVGLCWSKSLLGVDCPFCGGLRCVNSLAHGDWLAAADHNVLLAVVLPVLVALWVVWLVRSLRDEPFTLPRPGRGALVAGLVLLVAFTVARNVGGPAWVDWLASSTWRA